MTRLLALAVLLALSPGLVAARCGGPEAVSLEELRQDVAPAFTYGLYCDEAGRLQGERSAVLLVHRSAHLERVYTDDRAGDAQARELVRQLEEAVQRSGEALGDQAQGVVCGTLPSCTVHRSAGRAGGGQPAQGGQGGGQRHRNGGRACCREHGSDGAAGGGGGTAGTRRSRGLGGATLGGRGRGDGAALPCRIEGVGTVPPGREFRDRFRQALEFQRRVGEAMKGEARGAAGARSLLRGLERPLVTENVGLAHESGSLTYVDQLVVDEASLGSTARPSVHSFSNKKHDFSAKDVNEAVKQLRVDIREARSKYGGTVEVRRPGHPLFGRKVIVTRVHLVYDGKGLP